MNGSSNYVVTAYGTFYSGQAQSDTSISPLFQTGPIDRSRYRITEE